MRVLSLFDGISCGMLALQRAGIPVECYDAFEIDKYAVTVSSNNFPEIVHHGNVFDGDFTKFKGYDLLIGGSPCTYWSIAKKGRETTSDGMGFKLFMEYVRALRESECKYFLYENNFSIHQNIKDEISKYLGVQPIMINSALVSGQHRKRCYWTNIPNVTQPHDKGILLKDVLESGLCWQNKSYCMTANYHPSVQSTLDKHRNSLVAEPIILNDSEGKSRTIKAQYSSTSLANAARQDGFGATMVAVPLDTDSIMKVKEATVKGYTEINSGECVDLTMPNSTTRRGRKMTEKSNCLTTSCAFYEYIGKISDTSGNADEPVRISQLEECETAPMTGIPVDTVNGKSHTIPATYYKAGTNLFPSFQSEKSRQKIAVPIPVGCAQRGRYADNDKTEQHIEVRHDGKSNCLTTVQKDSMICTPVRIGQYGKGGQGQRIYSVRGKSVTLSANGGGQGAKTGLYKIDLPDGDYVIRKLTPIEAERLQTLPDNYTAGISNTQRYKCIGNGWTVDVIAHILGGLNDD